MTTQAQADYGYSLKGMEKSSREISAGNEGR